MPNHRVHKMIATRRALQWLILSVPLGNLSAFAQSRSHEGQQIFAARCATCHGLDAQGSERGPNIASRAEVRQLSDQALRAVVQKGIPSAGMPSFRALGDSGIDAVVRHLRRLQGRGTEISSPGDPASGHVLFSGKARCVQCHAVNGEGGFLGPDLSNYAKTQSVEQIRNAITEPNKNLDQRNRTVVVIGDDGTAITGITRNEDNFSLQLQTVDGAFRSFLKSDLRSIERQPHSLMPDDYGSRLSRREINDIISFLIEAGRARPKGKTVKNENRQ